MSTPIGLFVAFAPRHGSAVPPRASARTCKRKSVVTNVFLVGCGAQGIVEPAGGRQSWESTPHHDPPQREERSASRRGAEIVRSTIHRFSVVSFENQVAFGV